MLLHDDYYNFTLQNCDVQDGLMVANEMALITLKAKAYLNNLQRKADGHEIRENDIIKHKKDVLKLIATLTGNEEVNCPDIIKNDIATYVNLLKKEQPDIKGLAKEAGLGSVTQIPRRPTPLYPRNLIRHPFSNHLPSFTPCLRTNINYPFARSNYRHIMLHHNNRITRRNQAVQLSH